MIERPRLGAILILLSIGVAIWVLSARLGEGPIGPRVGDDRLTSSNLPAREDTWHKNRYPVPPPPSNGVRRVELRKVRVVDTAGRPVVGAIVRADENEVCSDHDGRCVVASSAGEITIAQDGFFPFRADELPPAEDASGDAGEHTIVLVPGARIVGAVRSKSGRPVSGARVTLRPVRGGPLVDVTTLDDGSWEGPLLRPGAVIVRISHADFRPHERTLLLTTSKSDESCEVRLESGQPILIHAVDDRKRPLADADVWVDIKTPAKTRTRHYLGRTDDLGEFSCHRPPSMHATVIVRLAGYRETRAEVDRAPLRGRDGLRERVQLTLTTSPALAAQAVDATTGLPVAPHDVTLERLSSGAYRTVPHRGLLYGSLPNGRIRAGLPPQPGEYRLVVRAEGGRFGISPSIRFDGAKAPEPFVVRLEYRPGISGIILADGKPVAGADVELLADADEVSNGGGALLDDDSSFLAPGVSLGPRHDRRKRLYGVAVEDLPRATLTARTAVDGRFTFAGAPSELCRIAVRHDGYADYVSAPIALPLSDPEADVPITLEKGGSIVGELVGVGGEPAVGKPVVLTSSSTRARVAWTDVRGHFTFDSLPRAEDYRVTSGRDEGVPQPIVPMAPGSRGPLSVTPGERTSCKLPMTLSPAGRLTGTARFDGDAFLGTIRILAGSSQAEIARVATAADGSFGVEPLPPGNYTIVGVEEPWRYKTRIRPRETTTADIDYRTLSWDVEIVSMLTGDRLGVPCRIRISKARSKLFSREVIAENGHAVVDKLWPGQYRVTFEADEFVRAERIVDLQENLRYRDRLDPGRSVSIRLVEESGEVYRGPVEVTVKRGVRIVHRGSKHVVETLDLPPLPAGAYDVAVKLGPGGPGGPKVRTANYSLKIGPAVGK